MEYNFTDIESKWQKYWHENETYRIETDTTKPKFYVLDMFPYPSGAGLHVGHPLGYIASDIYSRYKRMCGFNVLHPMGYDAFGLPAEQYAIQTGKHPAETTEINIRRYREQLDKIGFSYDWNREVRTSDPQYYRWTQWAFMKMFNHWFNNKTQRAEPIELLIKQFEQNGNLEVDAACNETPLFSANEWNSFLEKEQQEILMNYRIAYRGDTIVNWCQALGTVLANDEVKEGFSVRGNHPVIQKKMKQWMLRVTAYCQRLLSGLESLNWSDSLIEIQRNWIGRSEGAEIEFELDESNDDSDVKSFIVFTTRPDTLFGCTFMVLAPESELAGKIVSKDYKEAVNQYISETKRRSERERISEIKKVTGQFTGRYAIHPFTKKHIPIWTSDYVLAGYGTGAIMAVPAHDSRDYAFAQHFNLPVVEVVSGGNIEIESYDAKSGILIHSDFINGLDVQHAIVKMNNELETNGFGKRKVNFRMRDAIFSRQRYWGEPFPVYYKNEIPYLIDEKELPLQLPEIDAFLPSESGEPPLSRAKNWNTKDGFPYELSTMPGFAGSSAYYLRYMDPHNNDCLVSEEANHYWQDVDLYVGGTEHATGHLIYSRFWNKFLYDIGVVCRDEPYKKLINQGMIQGRSNFVYRIKNSNTFVSYHLKEQYECIALHVDVNLVRNDVLDIEAFRNWNQEYKNAEFVTEEGKYICGWAVEKMSKSMYNVVNPDNIIEKYGADTLRLYEMFLGPIEQAKPWDTNGIEGVHKFLRKFWRLFSDRDKEILSMSDEEPTAHELKILHKTIKKITEDIENFSFNTSVSAFMICVNELTEIKCNKRSILEPLVKLISPFAPHIAEEIWQLCGHNESITSALFPVYNETYLTENSFEYPVSFNGKLRFKLSLSLGLSESQIEEAVLAHADAQKWLSGKTPKKVIVVKSKIINVVV